MGTTFNTSREKVIQDVKGNYIDPKRIIVVWLKEGSLEYKMAMNERGELG